MAGLDRDRAGRFLVANLARGEATALTVALQAGFRRAVGELGKELPKSLRDLGAALDVRAIPESVLRETNMELAKGAQEAIMAGWRSRLPRHSGPYRKGARLTGTLGPALSSPAMLEGTTASRISFINPKVLANEAVHWYRVNYGAAGPNASGGREQEAYSLNVNGRPIAVLRDDSPMAPNSWLPQRFMWVGGLGEAHGGIFQPTKGPADRIGDGVRAARFVDLGLKSVADNFGPAYIQMFDRFIRNAENRTKLRSKNISVPMKIRRPPSFG